LKVSRPAVAGRKLCSETAADDSDKLGTAMKIKFEPIVSSRVQWCTGRIKKIIAPLLPVFWLAALMHGPWESSAFDWLDNGCASCNAAGNMAPLSGHSCSASDDYIRCEVRRISGDRMQAAPPRFEPVATDNPLPLRRLTPAIPLTGEAFLLQQRWQFVWRTADFPRAPSFLA
jgi:hypothetical protein